MFPRRRPFQSNPLNSDQLAILVQANQLLSVGKPLEAAPLFAQLAGAMQASQHPRRAANLYARAAHAYADANRPQLALTNARAALALFIQTQMPARTGMFYANITRKLKDKGMPAAAEALQKEYGARLPTQPIRPQPQAHPPRGLLPTNCTKCGAPVHPEDVTWVDDLTIECAYCGALIRSE